MKYFIIGIVCVAVIAMVVTGYFIIQQKPSLQNDNILSQTPSDEIKSLKLQITKLQRELNDSKDILSKQSLFMQQLEGEISADRAKITNLEKKANPASEENEQASLNQAILNELFQNPQFIQMLQQQMATVAPQTTQNVQQTQPPQPTAHANEQAQQNISKRIDDLGKNLNLNDSQKPEFSRILTERANKLMELSSKLRSKELTQEDYKTQTEAVRNESNESIKQILLPDQYEKYQKAEPAFNRRLLQGGRQPFSNRPR